MVFYNFANLLFFFVSLDVALRSYSVNTNYTYLRSIPSLIPHGQILSTLRSYLPPSLPTTPLALRSYLSEAPHRDRTVIVLSNRSRSRGLHMHARQTPTHSHHPRKGRTNHFSALSNKFNAKVYSTASKGYSSGEVLSRCASDF